jgi:hypothetical protein
MECLELKDARDQKSEIRDQGRETSKKVYFSFVLPLRNFIKPASIFLMEMILSSI